MKPTVLLLLLLSFGCQRDTGQTQNTPPSATSSSALSTDEFNDFQKPKIPAAIQKKISSRNSSQRRTSPYPCKVPPTATVPSNDAFKWNAIMTKKVLFVCLGNICRSPAAEGVFSAMVKKTDFGNSVYVDSAGTAAYHTGERADSRMISHAAKRGYDLTSIARKFTRDDFEEFDFIVVMDRQNYRDVLSLAENDTHRQKVSIMTDYLEGIDASEVPDPYYQGARGFEYVLDIIENASQNLLKKIT